MTASDGRTTLSIVRRLRFCAGHRLLHHEGQCAYLHGHSYRVDVEVAPATGGTTVDAAGRIVDFAVVKRLLLGWIDAHWDHAFILAAEDTGAIAAVRAARPVKLFILPWHPTAENMARYLVEIVCPTVFAGLGVVARRVTVWETVDTCAHATCDGSPAPPPFPPGTAFIDDDRPPAR